MRHIFSERKQVGIIYHFTELDFFEQMVSRDLQYLVMKTDNYNYISFTRNFRLADTATFFTDVKAGRADTRIAFYGDLLSDRYKIQAFHDAAIGVEDRNDPWVDEDEERIIDTSQRYKISIEVPGSYIHSIQFNWGDDEGLMEDEDFLLVKFIKQNNIPVFFDEKWLNPMQMRRKGVPVLK